MNPLNIRSGWWVFTDDRFVACYDTKEEAVAHCDKQLRKNINNIDSRNEYIIHFNNGEHYSILN